MNNIEYLLTKYNKMVTPGQKTVEELIAYLRIQMDIEVVEVEAIVDFHRRFMAQNVVNSLLNERLNLSVGNLGISGQPKQHKEQKPQLLRLGFSLQAQVKLVYKINQSTRPNA